MSCTQEYVDFVCAQLSGAGNISTREMFGECCVLVDDKPVALTCENLTFVVMHPAIAKLMKGAWTSHPFKGAKECYVLEIENKEKALSVVKTLLPVIKPTECY